ncbi:hypothetical protein SAMN02745121_04651 [Nannocystis exedens]|uniref:Lipoprotein n=1 Tax=Nannocystis exedens TaxID=54 RepID=A0A1I2BF69_9BACT|nr:hypothetical protein [Nannocystis exedens]PCC68006.1 hypothetical protein NAEX_01014 [Nannocystis exedens]SFE54814.1 hypothetical protein SAMN02745121_04651 [Nannocystis exedens]
MRLLALCLSLLVPALSLACSSAAHDTGSHPAAKPAAPAPAPAAPAAPAPAPEPAAQPPASAGSIPVLPELRETSDVFMEALLSGTLIEQSGCLRVSPDGKQPGHLLIWQPGYTARRAGDRVEVVDGTGKVVARVGEPLRTGGGHVSLNEALRKQLKTPLDAACVGPYWLMGQLQAP